MPNLDTPFGARLVGHTSGSPLNARIRQYTATTATAVFPGDFVKMVDAGTVEPAAAGDALLGVCIGVVPTYTDLSLKYKPASTAGTILVCDDPSAEYEIQEDGDGAGAGAAFTTAAVGSNGDIVATAGSTTRGMSLMELDSSDVLAKDTTPASAQLRVVALVNRIDNAAGNFAKWIVRINEHQFAQNSIGL